MTRCRNWNGFIVTGTTVALLLVAPFARAQPTPPPLPPPNIMPLAPLLPSGSGGINPVVPTVTPFNLTIPPNAPVKDLLPAPPKAVAARGPVVSNDIANVPEVEFQAAPENGSAEGKPTEQAARQLARINHLNAKKRDGFMTALIENRADLAGLPFAMGDDCRTSGERRKQFEVAVASVRQALSGQVLGGQVNADAGQTVQPFWTHYATICDQQDAARPKSNKTLAEQVTVARIAALMQMLAPESEELRLGLVKYLSAVQHVEATRALARLAIFAPEDEVRFAAIATLKVRREKDYTDILVSGLRYPWPAVAGRAADAIARTGRADLIPELIAVLDEADPRLPRVKSVWSDALVVRELVKVNHHRNCMMCHAPVGSEVVQAGALVAEVPVPGQPLPTPAEGYRRSTPELMIRIDVTYLRSDFSAVLAVGDAHPWPEAQRFDFLVRERQVTAEEAEVYREKLTPKEAGVLSPYHKAALAALRELTGKDTTPTAEAWRKLLDLPAKKSTSSTTKTNRTTDTATGDDRPRWIGAGTLKVSALTLDGLDRKTYRLETEPNEVLLYVLAGPGVDLSDYDGKRVSVFGTPQTRKGLSKQVVVATKVMLAE